MLPPKRGKWEWTGGDLIVAVTFAAPSYRAGGSDLTIAISPLGLVELADEEFEVHGPRLNRYATN